jgi:uncharacterized membrane protein YhaH (DUF805 family)
MNPLIRPWRQLFSFSGRATRTEYLLFHVTAIVALIVVGMGIDLIAAATVWLTGTPGTPGQGIGDTIMIGLLGIMYLLLLVAHLAICIRRLHDQGEPGIKFLLNFIPLIGWIFYLMMIFKAGDDDENDYGHDPRQGDPVATEELGGVFS